MAEPQATINNSVPDLTIDHRLKVTAVPETGNAMTDGASPDIGQLVEGKGVYVGIWAPEDRDGTSLGEIFDLYAAPEDVQNNKGKRLLLTFNEAVDHVAALQDYYGHDGFNHDGSGLTEDEVLYEALKTGSYKGEWFIPPKDALKNNLYENHHIGALKGTLMPSKSRTINILIRNYLSCWYWSCTGHGSSSVWIQSFTSGDVSRDPKDTYLATQSTRLVRAEPRPG